MEIGLCSIASEPKRAWKAEINFKYYQLKMTRQSTTHLESCPLIDTCAYCSGVLQTFVWV